MDEFDSILASSDPEVVFPRLMIALGGRLQCDRCFLYLRDPQTRLGKVPYCWSRPEIPDVTDTQLKLEPPSLPLEDPLFAAALRTEPSIFIEDVETAPPHVVNRAFERENFGHRALIHAHLCHEGQLWGILQPCVFKHPRQWSDVDRTLIAQVTAQITPLAIAYVKTQIRP